MKNSDNYWEEYYQSHNELNTPWEGVRSKFFVSLWDKYQLPNSGVILDVGCGRGSKSIYFAQKGFEVWGFDISTSAISDAVKASEHLSNKPHFIVGDIANFDQIKQLESVSFDVVLDKLSSQFLKDEQKETYLSHLGKHIKNNGYLILQIFGKSEQESDNEKIPDWIKKIYKSNNEIENIYGKLLKIVGSERMLGTDGVITDTYILKNG